MLFLWTTDHPQSPGKESLDFHVEQKGSELLPVSSSTRGPLGDGAQLGGDRCGLGLMKHVWTQTEEDLQGSLGEPAWTGSQDSMPLAASSLLTSRNMHICR